MRHDFMDQDPVVLPRQPRLDSKGESISNRQVIRLGSGGGAMAFCLGRPGSNPGLEFGFFQFRIAVNLFSLSVGLFLITCNRTMHTLSSSFLFPIIVYHCANYQL